MYIVYMFLLCIQAKDLKRFKEQQKEDEKQAMKKVRKTYM